MDEKRKPGRPRVTPEHRREMQRLNAARWRAANPERYRELSRQSDARRDPERTRASARGRYRLRAAQIREAKTKPCTDCRVSYPFYVMHFDHLGEEPKLFSLGRAGARKWETILAEIAKCDVVCANCHAERTYQRLQRKADTNVEEFGVGG